MVVYQIEKKRLDAFLDTLKRSYELVAPVKRDLVRFEKVKDVSDIHLAERSYFPLKEAFFRKHELIFTYDGSKITPQKLSTPPTIFFGLRRCDLNAIERQDRVFMHDTEDPYYTEARENSYLLGYHCDRACNEYCFCGSMELEDFHDLMFYDKGAYLLVETGSDKGKALLEKHKKFFSETDKTIAEKTTPGTDRLKRKDISSVHDHPDWKKGVDLCFSCAACTNLCPTCYCFELHDEPSTKNPRACSRFRTWSSCQLQSFTRVAGGHVFREKRDERFRHRIYHQLQYYRQRYGKNLCVGCGRCIAGCPTRIDFVRIINEMP